MATCAPHAASQNAPTPKELRDRVIAEHFGILDDSLAVLRFNPPSVFHQWYAEIIGCSGVKFPGSLPPVFVAPITEFQRGPNEAPSLAFYNAVHRYIVFGLGWERVDWVARHEFLHDALQLNGIIPSTPFGESYDEMRQRTHPLEYFGGVMPDGTVVRGKCGMLVRRPGSFPPLSPDSSKHS